MRFFKELQGSEHLREDVRENIETALNGLIEIGIFEQFQINPSSELFSY